MSTRKKSRINPTAFAVFCGILGVLSFFQQPNAQLKAKVIANRQQMANFLHTTNIKIVFSGGTTAEESYLYYIDYSENTTDPPLLHKISIAKGASSPSISFDGHLIAYNTDASSQIKAAAWMTTFSETAQATMIAPSNAYEPRFEKRTDSTIVIYTSTWTQGDWASGKTLAKHISGATPDSSPFILESSGSYHGGLSWDSRYLATTQFEPNPRIIDRSTSTVFALHNLIVKNIKNNADSMVSPQACNCSVSSSHIFTDVMLYLDFGLPANLLHPILGRWDFHKRIFVTNSHNNVVRWIDFPDSLYPANNGSVTSCCWTHTEWAVNHPYYAVSGNIASRAFLVGSECQGTQNPEDIYLIDLKNKAFLKVVESTDTSLASTTFLQWPSAWIETPEGFIEDSSWLDPKSNVKRPSRAALLNPFNGISMKGNIINSKMPIKKVTIIDLAGRTISTCHFPETSIFSYHFSNFSHCGLYFISILTNKTLIIPYYCYHKEQQSP